MTTPSTPARITYREASRIEHAGISQADVRDQHLQLGAILRIADSLEAMAADRAALIRERDTLRTSLDDANSIIKGLSMEVAGLKGAIARHRIPINSPAS